MAEVLMYNLADGDKRRRLLAAFLRMGFRARDVEKKDWAHPLGYLAGIEGYESAGLYDGEGFRDEMLVFYDLAPGQLSALLDRIRAARATVALKAVLTETNAAWNSLELRDAVKEEHDTMRELRERRGR